MASASNKQEQVWERFLKAVNNEKTKDVIWLAKQKVVRTRTNNCPMELIITMHKNKALAALIKSGFDVNKSSKPYLNTPLHVAVLQNNLQAVKLLIGEGADLEKLNIYHFTAFY